MSVFERTLKAAASPQVFAEHERICADKALADALAKQEVRDRKVHYTETESKFVPLAFKQFARDSEKNGFWAEFSVGGVAQYLDFIPILGASDYLRKDHGGFLLPLSPCKFTLRLLFVPATAAAPALVQCDWFRPDNLQGVRQLFKDVYLNDDGSKLEGGFFSNDFVRYKVDVEPGRTHYLPTRTATHTPLSEVVAAGGAFVEAVLAEFMAYCIQTAEAEALQMARTPFRATSSNGSASPAHRGILGWLFGRE